MEKFLMDDRTPTDAVFCDTLLTLFIKMGYSETMRHIKMKMQFRPLVLSLVFAAFLLTCTRDKNPLGHEGQPIVPIPIDVVADAFGNHNGIASHGEVDSIVNYFAGNNVAWALGGFPTPYCDVNEIPINIVLDQLRSARLSRPYANEKELRDAFKGCGVRTPWVGIYAFVSKPQYSLKAFYRSPGGYFSDHHWTQMRVLL